MFRIKRGILDYSVYGRGDIRDLLFNGKVEVIGGMKYKGYFRGKY